MRGTGPGVADGLAASGDAHARMGSIGRYIFRTTFGAFLVVLVSVTALMWITQALRNFDLMTNQGQSILVFVGITGLIIPHAGDDHRADRADDRGRARAEQARQRFRTDRHERRRHAPWHVFRPFLALGILVSLVVAWISFYLSPMCLQELRRWATRSAPKSSPATCSPAASSSSKAG